MITVPRHSRRGSLADRIRMVASDFDGTILNWKTKRITDRTIRAVRSFCSGGRIFVIATARPYYALRPFLKRLDGEVRRLILCNGAWIRDGGRDVFFRPLHASVINRLRDVWWDREDVRLMLIGRTSTLINRYSPERYIRKYQGSLRSRVVPAAGIHGDILNVEADGPAEVLRSLTADLRRICGKRAVCRQSWPDFMEIYSGGVSKGSALRMVSRLTGCRRREIAAFGDGNNDLDLLRAAGIRVAVSNATREMKKAADYITGSCNEDGVARFIEERILRPA